MRAGTIVRAQRVLGGVRRPLKLIVRWQRWALSRFKSVVCHGTLGGSVERVIEINFGVHVPLDQVTSLVTGFGACGLVRALDDTQRNYAVTVRRAGAMEYLETLLARGERHGWFAWRFVAP